MFILYFISFIHLSTIHPPTYHSLQLRTGHYFTFNSHHAGTLPVSPYFSPLITVRLQPSTFSANVVLFYVVVVTTTWVSTIPSPHFFITLHRCCDLRPASLGFSNLQPNHHNPPSIPSKSNKYDNLSCVSIPRQLRRTDHRWKICNLL